MKQLKTLLLVMVLSVSITCGSIFINGDTSIYTPAKSASKSGVQILVAAFDSTPEDRKAAGKFLCDGTDDDVQIQFALNAVAEYTTSLLYTAGTVAIDQSTTTLAGTDTVWTSAFKGNQIIIATVKYTIASITSPTELEITDNYVASNGSGLAYSINPELGGEIRLAAGTYSIGDEIAMQEFTTISGSGHWDSRLIFADGVSATHVSNDGRDTKNIFNCSAKSDIMISNLYLGGNSDNNGMDSHEALIHLASCLNPTVKDCFITDGDAAGIISVNGTNVEISGNTVTDCKDDGIEIFGQVDQDNVDVRIINNTINDCSIDGLPNPSGCLKIRNNNKNVTVSGNSITTSGKFGIVLFTSSGEAPSNDTGNCITGNTVLCTANEPAGAAIHMFAAAGKKVQYWTISGNALTHEVGRGIRFDALCNDIAIVGNTITGGDAGVNMGSTTVSNIMVANNVISAFLDSGADVGIGFHSASSSYTVANNVISGFDTYGIHVWDNTVPVGVTIVGNTISGANTGVFFRNTNNAGSNNMIFGNNLSGCTNRFHNDSDASADTIPTSWDDTGGNIGP